MTTVDELAVRLIALSDVLIAFAAIVCAPAVAYLALISVRLIRRPRLTTREIVVPAGPPPAAELLFTLVRAVFTQHGSGRTWLRTPIVLGAHGTAHGLRLRLSADEGDMRTLSKTLSTIWPGAQLAALSAPRAATHAVAALEWRARANESSRPKGVPGAELSLPRALARVETEEELALELALRPTTPPRAHPPIWNPRHASISPRSTERSRRVAGTLTTDALDCRIVASAHASTQRRAAVLVRELEPVVHVLPAGSGVLVGSARATTSPYRVHLGGDGGALTATDLAAIFPLGPLASAVAATSAPAPVGERLLGLRRVGATETEVRLSIAASRQHLHVLGPTGTGKSTLLLNLVSQDIAAGRGCAVLDPKGDLVRDLLRRIPRRRVDDVVYVGPDEASRVVGINPLQLAPHEDPAVAAENVLAIFKRVYADSWGPRTDDVLKSCLLTLVAVPGATLAHIPALLSDGAFRRELTATVDDVGVGGFWRWYERVSEGKRLEVAAPLQHKLRDVLVRPRLRRLLCQTHSSVQLSTLMDQGGILLADLGTGRWGEGASALAGNFLVARLWQAALSRQARSEKDRADFLLYVDEFQTFLGIGGPFADALAQARALRLSLTLANQHLGQLPREMGAAVAANARSRIVFRASAPDAAVVAAEFDPLDEHALLSLPPFEAAVRLGDTTGAFTARMMAPAPIPLGAAAPDEVLRRSAARYGRPVVLVDEELRRTVGLVDAGDEPTDLPSPS